MKLTGWKEVAAMRSLVHENIIDYYDHFIVQESSEKPRKKKRQREMSDRIDIPGTEESRLRLPEFPVLWIMMEFADAGNLLTEMSRYPENCNSAVRSTVLQLAGTEGLEVHAQPSDHTWGSALEQHCSQISSRWDEEVFDHAVRLMSPSTSNCRRLRGGCSHLREEDRLHVVWWHTRCASRA